MVYSKQGRMYMHRDMKMPLDALSRIILQHSHHSLKLYFVADSYANRCPYDPTVYVQQRSRPIFFTNTCVSPTQQVFKIRFKAIFNTIIRMFLGNSQNVYHLALGVQVCCAHVQKTQYKLDSWLNSQHKQYCDQMCTVLVRTLRIRQHPPNLLGAQLCVHTIGSTIVCTHNTYHQQHHFL